jgi:hypothetical protein
MAKVNSLIASVITAQYIGAGTVMPIKTVGGVYYQVYAEAGTSDLVFRKSTDGGKTWSAATVIQTNNVTNLAVWYDRWSGISAGLIHIAFVDSLTDDTQYVTIDTENSDSLSTITVIFAGASTANGGALSITRARGGNVYCKTCIDAGVEGGFARLLNANVPNGAWAARTNSEALATTDQWALLPDYQADNQDIQCIFVDASADELSVQRYDDSADTWAETTISGAGGMVDVAATTNYPHFAAFPDLTNSKNVVFWWTAVDLLNADLKCSEVTASAVNALTDVVTNSTDDQGFVAAGLNTDNADWHVYYGGKSDGSDTFATAISLNYKISTDDGSTWGSETDLVFSGSAASADILGGTLVSIHACPRFDTRQIVVFMTGTMLLACIDEPAAAAGVASSMFGGGVVQ